MVLRWMLWIAILCRTSRGDDVTATTALASTDIHQSELKNILTTETSLLAISTDNIKPTRDKRNTGQILNQLLTENELALDDGNNVKIKRDRGRYVESPRVRFSSWAGKRAKFSSWGGKRNGDGMINNLVESNAYGTPEEKRAKFSSWAGKRGGEEGGNNWNGMDRLEDKRTKFSSWAGKRDEEKRKFSSWAGKRFDNNQELNDIEEDKRAKFSSWAGKRAKFNSWGGKRFFNEDGNDYDDNIIEEKRKFIIPWKNNDDYGVGDRKRAKFSSWGGKRADENEWSNNVDGDDNEDEKLRWNDDLKRARFNSWGGKRNDNITNLYDENVDHRDDGVYKRSASAYSPLSWKRKPIFSSWGGKRTARSAQNQRRLVFPSSFFRDHSSWGSLLRPIRRGPDFYAWGGKRST